LARATVELPIQDGVVVEITVLEQDNGGPLTAQQRAELENT